MNGIVKTLVFSFLTMLISQHSFAQVDTTAKELLVVDAIQIDIKKVEVDPKTDIASMELFLTSYASASRELKLNTFATQLVDVKGERSYFSTMNLAQVMVKFADKQNYLNYLLQPDEPVLLKVTFANWTKKLGKPKTLFLAFEDSEEEGHYIETAIQL